MSGAGGASQSEVSFEASLQGLGNQARDGLAKFQNAYYGSILRKMFVFVEWL